MTMMANNPIMPLPPFPACPECYNLVRDGVNDHRQNLDDFLNKIENFLRNPEVVNDEEFEEKLKELEGQLNRTIDEARQASG